MSEVIEFTKKWIAKAEADLKAAKHLLDSDDVATDAVCFHSQQTVEKYLKAFLVYHGVDFPKTHDVSFLIELCKTIDKEFGMLYELNADSLTEFGVEVRYPEEFYTPTEEEAKECLEISKKIRTFVRKKMDDVVGDEKI